MKRLRQKKHFYARTILLIAFLAAAAMLGSMMLHKYLARHQTPQTPVQPKPAGTVPVTLFFSSADGTGFVREAREIEGSCNTDISPCIRAILEELANGPLGDLAPTIPQNSSFRSIQIQGDTAVIDLGTNLVESLPKGSSAEMTAVYSMVDTITFNFPTIKKVQFLVEGQNISTLDGHLYLGKPLEPDFQLEKQGDSNSANDSPDSRSATIPAPGGNEK
ncbi:MAG: GerMN domain-containing protein [Geobacteraceae bacterium]|nr:GerMN domain-containing protein [Geobacteraceae bacterium]